MIKKLTLYGSEYEILLIPEGYLFKSSRNREIYEAFLKGMSMAKIGKDFNLSGQRIKQIILKNARKIYLYLNPEPEFTDLTEDTLVADLPISFQGNYRMRKELLTIKDFIGKSDKELLTISGFGRRSLNKIDIFIEKYGFHRERENKICPYCKRPM